MGLYMHQQMMYLYSKKTSATIMVLPMCDVKNAYCLGFKRGVAAILFEWNNCHTILPALIASTAYSYVQAIPNKYKALRAVYCKSRSLIRNQREKNR